MALRNKGCISTLSIIFDGTLGTRIEKSGHDRGSTYSHQLEGKIDDPSREPQNFESGVQLQVVVKWLNQITGCASREHVSGTEAP